MNMEFVRRWRLSHIGRRLLAFNLLVVFVPVVGVLYLDVYETHLREAQERGMVQQARILAATIGDQPAVDPTAVEGTFARMERRSDARVRVYDARGAVVADSARVTAGQPGEQDVRYGAGEAATSVRDRVLYRVGAAIARLRRRTADRLLTWRTPPSGADPNVERDRVPSDVRAALAGRYGAATRLTAGQRSVTLFVAVPVRHEGAVTGAVVVSQSTFRILRALYDVRLRVFEIVVASLVAAIGLTLLAATTIVDPLTKLRRQAAMLAERRGPLPAAFPGSRRSDEIGDLARALEELTRRTSDHIQLLQSFAADVSHELKNPLASIRTAAEMMAGTTSEEERRRFLALMSRDVDRLERLVSGLREVALLERQIEEDATEAVDVAALLAAMVDAVSVTARRRVVATFAADGPFHTVRAARERLAQVFENLLANAVSFAPDESAVDVHLTAIEGTCVITIDDCGPGIPETHLQRVFERFFSYRPRGGRRDHVGLGLAIAKQIVEGYGGTITASNRSTGGARFEVRLPLVAIRPAEVISV
jgi:two-component system, OmpR family, sensor histidine kinase ChvG